MLLYARNHEIKLPKPKKPKIESIPVTRTQYPKPPQKNCIGGGEYVTLPRNGF
jgi:hypothetical protein